MFSVFQVAQDSAHSSCYLSKSSRKPGEVKQSPKVAQPVNCRARPDLFLASKPRLFCVMLCYPINVTIPLHP